MYNINIKRIDKDKDIRFLFLQTMEQKFSNNI